MIFQPASLLIHSDLWDHNSFLLPLKSFLSAFLLFILPFLLSPLSFILNVFFHVRLHNSRLLCRPLPTTPPHSPMFPFTDSQHSLPLSSALSPLYKDPHWWARTFCPSHTLLLILPHSMRRGDQLNSVRSVVLLSMCLRLDSLGSLIKTLYSLFSLHFVFFVFSPSVHPTFLVFLFIFLLHLCALTCLNSSPLLSPSWAPYKVTPSHTASIHLSHISFFVYFPHTFPSLPPTLS